MADDDVKVKPIVDGTNKVIGAATDAAFDESGRRKSGVGLRELLITILAPTLALIGVAVGVWDNARSQEAARKRDEAIRTAGLVLPYYEEVMNTTDGVFFALDECDAAWLTWVDTPAGSEEEAAAEQVIGEKCGNELRSAFASLDTALNQALLVSNEDLEPVVEEYQLVQEDFAEIARLLNSDLGVELTDEEFDQLNEDYDLVYDEMAELREELVEVVRAQVLLQSAS